MRAVNRKFSAGEGSSRRDPQARGFSAVELLAILVVISLMLLALGPAVAHTTAPVARAKCADNLRLLMQGATMFALDNRDLLPNPNWGTLGPGWLYTPGAGGLPPSTSDPSKASGTVWPYVKLTDAYMCPLDLSSRYYFSRYNQLSTYVMNGAVCGFGIQNGAAYSLSQFKPEAYCLFEPNDGPFVYNDGSSYPTSSAAPGRNHAGGTPVGTFSGAVVFPAMASFRAQQASPSRSLLWCSPATSDGR